ncbi:MAG: hypothetical protein Q9174_006461 [Haloplaca sp. 1 TL-2023]
MPYALSTTKRKFHDILDSISNGSTTSLDAKKNQHNGFTTSLTLASEPNAKRPKFTRPSTISSASSLLTHARSVSNRTNASTTSLASTMNEPKKPPNFAPWDPNQFLERLETFRQVHLWSIKPEPINEVQWARRGWRCIDNETVACVGGCSNQLVISLEPDKEGQEAEDGAESADEDEESEYYDDWRDQAQKELVKRYTEKIITEHSTGCLWRRKGCDGMYTPDLASKLLSDFYLPANIHRLPLAHHATTMKSLRQRYESLVAIAADLPSNMTPPEQLNVSKLIPYLFHILYPGSEKAAVSDHPSSPTRTTRGTVRDSSYHPTVNPRALTLAILGWQADADSSISGLATCTTCFRRLGLWLYHSPATPSAGSPAQPSSPVQPKSPQSPPPTSPAFQTRSESIISRLDPTGEHRDYCPWVNGKSQSRDPSTASEESPPGWEILKTMIMNLRPPGGFPISDPADGNDRSSSGSMDGARSEVQPDTKSKEEKDKERWARLKKLKQVFKVNRKPKAQEKPLNGTK